MTPNPTFAERLAQYRASDAWHEHYEEFMECIRDEGRVGATTSIAAEQYADDMMEDEAAA